MAWQQIKRTTPYLWPTPSGNLTPCLPNPNYFYCLISRGVSGTTHNRVSLLLLPLSLAVCFSATLLPSSPVNQIMARDPGALVLPVLSQAFGHSNFQGIICKAEKHQPCLSCFPQVFLFPGDNSFISGSLTEKSAIQLHYFFGL